MRPGRRCRPADQETRYRYAQEWYSVIQRLWSEDEPFEFDGEFWQLARTYTNPKPLAEKMPVTNAAGSAQGREFTVNNADFLFATVITLEQTQAEIQALKKQASAIGRTIDVMTLASCYCRPTEKEAQEYYRHIVDRGDDGALDNIIEIMFANAESFPKDALAGLRERFAAGHGGWPLIGTPDQVADGIEAMARAGLAGTVMLELGAVGWQAYVAAALVGLATGSEISEIAYIVGRDFGTVDGLLLR